MHIQFQKNRYQICSSCAKQCFGKASKLQLSVLVNVSAFSSPLSPPKHTKKRNLTRIKAKHSYSLEHCLYKKTTIGSIAELFNSLSYTQSPAENARLGNITCSLFRHERIQYHYNTIFHTAEPHNYRSSCWHLTCANIFNPPGIKTHNVNSSCLNNFQELKYWKLNLIISLDLTTGCQFPNRFIFSKKSLYNFFLNA